MVTTATPGQMPLLAELWRLGFGDTEAYTRFVFDQLLSPDKILVYGDKAGRPLAMLCMEPMELVGKDYLAKGIYLYAFTVHPRFRGKTIGSLLLEDFHQYLKAKGVAASVLTPADKGLFAYYEKQGYQTLFAVRQLILDPQFLVPTNRPCILVGRSLDQLSQLREDFFGSSGLFVRWQPSYLRFVGKDAKLRGGSVLVANCDGQKGYLVYRLEAEEAVITEFAVPPHCMDDVLYALHRRVGAKEYKLRLPADYPARDKTMVLPFAMIQWYDKQNLGGQLIHAPYLSHVMD